MSDNPGRLVFAIPLNEKVPRPNEAKAPKGGTARRRVENGFASIGQGQKQCKKEKSWTHMARLVPGTGNFQKFRQPESHLAVDKHDSPLLRSMVFDDSVDSTRPLLHVDTYSRPACRRFHGPVIHFISRLCAWFVLQAAGRQHILRLLPRGVGVHSF